MELDRYVASKKQPDSLLGPPGMLMLNMLEMASEK